MSNPFPTKYGSLNNDWLAPENINHAGDTDGYLLNTPLGKERKDSSDQKVNNITHTQNNSPEAVSLGNVFSPDHCFIQQCVSNGLLGMTRLFESLYTKPKRIKWNNKGKHKERWSIWDGTCWVPQDVSFMKHLICTVLVNVLNDFSRSYQGNNDRNHNALIDENSDIILKNCEKMISKLNNGSDKTILKWMTSTFKTEF